MELANQGKEIFPLILRVMVKYSDNENIIENILRFFLLSLNGSTSSIRNKESLLLLNVIRITGEILSQNKTQNEVIRLGCGLILVLRYDDLEFKQRLAASNQLDSSGKASPKGSYEEIALAWELNDVIVGVYC